MLEVVLSMMFLHVCNPTYNEIVKFLSIENKFMFRELSNKPYKCSFYLLVFPLTLLS